MAGPGNILIKIGADAGQAVRELATVDKSLGSTMSTSEKMSAGLKKAALPAAAALGAIGFAAVDATKAAAEDAAAQEKLAGVLERTAGASKAQIAATEDWISATSRATGVADDELRPALEKIVTATHDVGKSQTLMKQALDISAASGKDVETVSAAIAKAYTGQTSSLEKLIPGLSESAKKSDDFNVIMGELAKTTGGAMAESADTAAGQYKIMTNQMGELQEELGTALLPVMKQFLSIMVKAIGFASEHTTAIKVLVGAVAALAGGILVANAAMKAYEAIQLAIKVATAAWTAAQWLLNAALTANPIGLVIVAVAALAAGIVIAYKKSEDFREIVQAALNAVKVAAQALDKAFDALLSSAKAAFNWISSNWKVAQFFFGPVAVAITQIATHFDEVKNAAQQAANIVQSVWKVGNFAFDAIAAAIRGITSAFESIAGAVYGAINAVRSLISWLGKIDFGLLGKVGGIIGKIPHLAAVPGPAVRGLAATPTAASSGGVGTINIYGPIDPEGTARAILRVLKTHERRHGKVV